jgi:propanol-preferring alcohol dehydrogenase
MMEVSPSGPREPLLKVENLVVEYAVGGKTLHAVSDVSLEVARGETLGLVGESGCGKSTLGRAVLQLRKAVSGRVLFDGQDLTAMQGDPLRRMRRRVQLIFQDPIASLNPRRRIGDIIAEPLLIAGVKDAKKRERLVHDVLGAVGLDPSLVTGRLPHEFSGGQCQRICIARALVLNPEFIICDEPVSALDVSIRAQILNLLEEMKARYGLTLLFIAHDLAVVKAVSDRVAVMYLGRLCEVGPSEQLFARPAHPYTALLIEAIPMPDPDVRPAESVAVGEPPSPISPPSGCRFRTRCPRADQRCADEVPELRELAARQFAACHHPLIQMSHAPRLSRTDRRGNVERKARNLDGRATMKSFQVAEFNAPLNEVDRPTPQPSGTQVLIKVKAAGVCHSDLHIWEGGYDLGHGRKPLSLKDRGVSLPRTMGHETVGEVLAFGPDAETEAAGLKVGDIALVYPWIGCGKCETCLGGDENLCLKPNSLGVYCDGGYADHMTVPHPKYLLNLEGLDPVAAAPYACSGVTTYSAIKKIEAVLHTPIVILGAGGLGLMALSLLKAMGGKGAIVVDIDARKREAAMAAGALATVDGKAPDALAQLATAAGGPIRAVIDLVGNAATAQLGFDCLSKGGKLVMVGLFGGGAPWALPLIPIKAITIQGSYVGNLRETQELLDLVREKKIAPIPVTPMPLAQANQALIDLQKGRLVGRAVLTP